MRRRTKILIASLTVVGLLVIGLAGAAFAADSAVKTATPPGIGERMGGGGWGIGSDDAIAKLLGMTKEEIQTQRQAGKSLVQIAATKNITEDALINAIMADRKAALDKQVAAGKLTQEQATKMLDQMKPMVKTMVESTAVYPQAGRGMPGLGMGPGMMGGFGFGSDDAIAKLLGMTKEEIQTQRQAGKSLVQIAATKNITEDALINAIMADRKAALDKQVAAGKLTQEQATKMLDQMKPMVKTMVESTAVGPQAGRGMPGPGMGPGMMGGFGFGSDDAIAKLLGMTKEEIQTQRQAGKSLVQIAATKNITEDALINAIMADRKAALDKQVAAGKLTQEQATKMLDQMKPMVKTMVESTAVGPQAGKGMRGGCPTPGAGTGPGMMRGGGNKQGGNNTVPGTKTGTGMGGMMGGRSV